MSNITINNTTKLKLKLTKSEYWDFKIANDDYSRDIIYNGKNIYDNSLISFINFDDSRCIGDNGIIYSTEDYG